MKGKQGGKAGNIPGLPPCYIQFGRRKRMKKYIGIDIGGTAIKYGLITEEGEILNRSERKTEASKGGPSILGKAVEIVESFSKTEEICGICISTAGMVDTEKGEIFYSAPLIPNYAGTKFKETMEEKFGIPCEVENDVNCAGLAEAVSGAAKGSSVSLMLTVGTGIGGCIVINGEVFHGFSNSACEVGYMHMAESDLQTLGAASILTRKVAAWKNEPEEIWNGYHIFEEAKKGDELCIRAIDEMADVLGQGIANICYVINPEIVVLGGGIMAQEEYLRGRIEAAVGRYLIPGIASRTKIAFAKHRNDAGMLGAFYHFKRRVL
jgi:predicted NBD/HSP70 family sugar kinase